MTISPGSILLFLKSSTGTVNPLGYCRTSNTFNGPANASIGYALGDLDAAFEALEVAVNEQDPLIYMSLRRAPWFEPLREDPRYDALVNLMESKEIHTSQYMLGRDQ